MASRRTRIKGIANIPQRKKTNPAEAESVARVENTEEITLKSSDNSDNKSEEKQNIEQTVNFIKTAQHPDPSGVIQERTFLKPDVTLSNKHIAHKDHQINSTSVINNSATSRDTQSTIESAKFTTEKSEVVLNETNLSSTESPLNSPVVNSPGIRLIHPDSHVYMSDVDYPIPPSSPSKFNRRIKAVPRLNQRKTSFSASESEDDTRRYSRIRNNSVCSVASTTGPDLSLPSPDNGVSKDIPPVIHKKMNRTEQSKKLAEARKEYNRRFGTNNPEKHKLKMIDLIFYNPTTNPMSQQNTSQSVADPEETANQSDKEEDADKIEENENDEATKKDSKDSMPVPQIKIGPSGEIILDEKSLIVENAEMIKQKQKIQNSQVINGNSETGYGIYRRVARSKEWTSKETLRFYKALNVIGTDFTVMSQLFPKRSRRELKQKFKKEDKSNGQLISKATMQPCMYNFADLKREIEIEMEEEATIQKLREEELEQKKKDKQLKKGRKRKINITDTRTEETNEPISSDSNVPPIKRHRSRTLNIKRVLSTDSDADVSDLDTQSEEEDVLLISRPTRSGRIPKPTQRCTVRNDIFETANKCSDSLHPEINPEKLVPGSLLVTFDKNIQSSYQVFMVTPDKNVTPLKLDSAVISNVVADKST